MELALNSELHRQEFLVHRMLRHRVWHRPSTTCGMANRNKLGKHDDFLRDQMNPCYKTCAFGREQQFIRLIQKRRGNHIDERIVHVVFPRLATWTSKARRIAFWIATMPLETVLGRAYGLKVISHTPPSRS